MSDVMLHGILNMPPGIWDNSDIHKAQRHDAYKQASKRIKELETRLQIDYLYPNSREYILQQTCRIDACIKHIEDNYDSNEPWVTPEEVKTILRGKSGDQG